VTDVRLHIVTGKGGTGKTTVAASLALALASGGERVLLCEVEGRQGIASLFDVAPLPYEERRAAGRSSRWPSTSRRRCWSTSTCSTASDVPARRSTASV
jgi:MinD superfamily P-loop ATPase